MIKLIKQTGLDDVNYKPATNYLIITNDKQVDMQLAERFQTLQYEDMHQFCFYSSYILKDYICLACETIKEEQLYKDSRVDLTEEAIEHCINNVEKILCDLN
jgi:hypothetical protein